MADDADADAVLEPERPSEIARQPFELPGFEIRQDIHALLFDAEMALADRALKEIMRETAKLTDAQEKVILYKYIDGMEWEDVATTADYSVRQTYELHGQALKRITPQ